MLLIDAIGAVITALLLSQVVARFDDQFGMPKNVVHVLALLACCLAIYSFSSYFFGKKNVKRLLRIVFGTNVLYCVLTTLLMIQHYEALTWLGLAYFVGEIIVIASLLVVEY